MTKISANWTFLLILLWAGQSFQYSCRDPERCECSIYGRRTNLSCPRDSNFKLTIDVEETEKATVTCSKMTGWSDLPKDSPTQIEDVQILFFDRCPLPVPNLHILAQRIGVQPTEKLKFESLKTLRDTLERRHLVGFPKLKELSLSSNGLTELPADLLADFTELNTLLLSDNNVILPQDFFNSVPKLKSLELGRNELTHIDPMLFRSLVNLTYLALYANDLVTFDKDTFVGLNELRTLEISQNKLTTLYPEVFQPMGNLTVLHMSRNNFSSLPEGLFSKNLNLTRFRFNDNRRNLTTLPAGFLSNLPKLSQVELVNLRLEALPEDIFWGSRAVVHINLSKNSLSTLPRNVFNESNSLKTLNLASNRLSNLPDGIFERLNDLTSLELQNNHLTSISLDLFKGLRSLIELNLEYNGLRSIALGSFGYLEALQIARLSHNQLNMEADFDPSILSTSSIAGPLELRELHLSHNNITTIFDDWMFNLPKLTKLDLTYNQLTVVTAFDFQFSSKNVEIDIRHNNISRIDMRDAELRAYATNPTNVRILIEDNPVICDCGLFEFIKYMNGGMHPNVQNLFHIIPGSLKCSAPDPMDQIQVSKLNYQTFQCLLGTCPENCTCLFREYDNTLTADCSYRSLTTAPQRIVTKNDTKIILDLTGNLLTEVPFVNQSRYGNITKLLLSRNRISKISPGNIPSTLVVLELHNNNLVGVNTTVLKHFEKMTSLKDLTLHENPWKCDCKAKDLLTFVQSKYKKIPNLVNLTCKNDTRPFSSLTPNDLCPTGNGIIIAVSVVVAVLSLMIGILAALYYRYQAEIKVWLYAHQMCLRFVTEEELDKDKLYDAFISYSHMDQDFVENELVPKLEEGPKPFKLCVHFRDWVAGEWIPAQIARSVEESRRTIIVLSPNFLESDWGRMEFRAAHSQALSEGRARVIVILYGDVGPTDKLDPELKAYLSMNTYVEWGDPWFWDKLRYALPHAPRVAQKNAQRIFENHQHHIKINGEKNELIYPPGVPPTPPAASTPPADSLKTFTSDGSLDKGVLITDCLKNGMTNYNNPNINDDRDTAIKREWENNVINRECTAM